MILGEQLVNKNLLNKNYLITRSNYSVPSTNGTLYFNFVCNMNSNNKSILVNFALTSFLHSNHFLNLVLILVR